MAKAKSKATGWGVPPAAWWALVLVCVVLTPRFLSTDWVAAAVADPPGWLLALVAGGVWIAAVGAAAASRSVWRR